MATERQSKGGATGNVPGVSYRRTESVIGETGLGQEPRTEVSHEIGVEVDGVFVPFATMSDERYAVLTRHGADANERAEAANGNAASGQAGQTP